MKKQGIKQRKKLILAILLVFLLILAVFGLIFWIFGGFSPRETDFVDFGGWSA